MNNFKWRLDRILQIKGKDQQLKRAQAAEIADILARTRSILLDKQKKLETLINSINCQNPIDRFQNQEIFINSSQADDQAIQKLSNDIANLEQQHRQKTKEVIEAKAFVEMLAKLRQKAYEKFVIEQNKIEQNDMDENFNLRLAKTLVEQKIRTGRE